MATPTTSAGATLAVARFPRPFGTNPYQRLFERALTERGVKLVERPAHLDPSWARRAHETVDAVHLHWLEVLYARGTIRGLRRLRSGVAARSVVRALRILETSPVRVVWTLHNLRPHENHLPGSFAAVRSATVSAADVVLCHSHAAAERARSELGRGQDVWGVPHGHYIDAYPSPRRTREHARAWLGIPPDAFVYLLFGLVRPYKRVPEAIEAFRSRRDRGAHLLVAGAVPNPTVRRSVEAAAGGDPRVVLHLRHIADDEVSEVHLAADALILNHRDLFSSGALMLGLSMGLPIVAPASGPIAETAPPPAAETFREPGLADALGRVRNGDPASRRTAALAAARACDWSLLADAAIRAYRGEQAPTGR